MPAAAASTGCCSMAMHMPSSETISLRLRDIGISIRPAIYSTQVFAVPGASSALVADQPSTIINTSPLASHRHQSVSHDWLSNRSWHPCSLISHADPSTHSQSLTGFNKGGWGGQPGGGGGGFVEDCITAFEGAPVFAETSSSYRACSAPSKQSRFRFDVGIVTSAMG